MKNLKNKLIAGLVVLASFAITSPIMACGKSCPSPYSPYSPYQPHIPEDTAFGGGVMEAMLIGGVFIYVVGMFVIAYSQKFKSLINKA